MLYVAQRSHRLLVPEDRHHAAHLIHQRTDSGQLLAHRRIAEKAIQALFDLAQRRLRFGDHGADRQPVLGAARQLRKPRPGFGQFPALGGAVQPFDHLAGPFAEFRIELWQLVGTGFDEQQREATSMPGFHAPPAPVGQSRR